MVLEYLVKNQGKNKSAYNIAEELKNPYEKFCHKDDKFEDNRQVHRYIDQLRNIEIEEDNIIESINTLFGKLKLLSIQDSYNENPRFNMHCLGCYELSFDVGVRECGAVCESGMNVSI